MKKSQKAPETVRKLHLKLLCDQIRGSLSQLEIVVKEMEDQEVDSIDMLGFKSFETGIKSIANASHYATSGLLSARIKDAEK